MARQLWISPTAASSTRYMASNGFLPIRYHTHQCGPDRSLSPNCISVGLTTMRSSSPDCGLWPNSTLIYIHISKSVKSRECNGDGVSKAITTHTVGFVAALACPTESLTRTYKALIQACMGQQLLVALGVSPLCAQAPVLSLTLTLFHVPPKLKAVTGSQSTVGCAVALYLLTHPLPRSLAAPHVKERDVLIHECHTCLITPGFVSISLNAQRPLTWCAIHYVATSPPTHHTH